MKRLLNSFQQRNIHVSLAILSWQTTYQINTSGIPYYSPQMTSGKKECLIAGQSRQKFNQESAIVKQTMKSNFHLFSEVIMIIERDVCGTFLTTGT